VPVIGWYENIQPGALGSTIASALKACKVVMVHGHGSFAIGQNLPEAYDYTVALETSSRIICLLRQLKNKQ